MFVSLVPDRRDVMEHPGELTLAVLSSMSGDPLSKAGSKTHIPKTHPGCWETILQIHPFNPWCPERFLSSPASEQSLVSHFPPGLSLCREISLPPPNALKDTYRCAVDH